MRYLSRLFIPSAQEVLIYTFVALVVLAAGNLTHLVTSLSGVQTVQISKLVQGQLDALPHANEVLGRLSLALFWIAVGAVLYILLWAVANAVILFHNQRVYKTGYTHPSLINHSHWAAAASRAVFRVAVLLLGLFYINTLINFLVPLGINLSRLFIDTFPKGTAWLAGAIAVGGLMLSLYLLPVLLRLFLLRPRVFGSSEKLEEAAYMPPPVATD